MIEMIYLYLGIGFIFFIIYMIYFSILFIQDPIDKSNMDYVNIGLCSILIWPITIIFFLFDLFF